MRPLLAFLLALLPTLAIANEPLNQADLKAAARLHEKSCTSCHARMYGGDGSKIYLREKRIVSNRQELQDRVATCYATANTGWTTEERDSVAAWLNQQYYRFKE